MPTSSTSHSASDTTDHFIDRRASIDRPVPPAEVADDEPERFVPDDGFSRWMIETFVAGSGPLANPDHEHLLAAKIGVLWTNSINVTKMRHVLATAEIPQTMGNAWKRGRAEQQLRDWFEFVPHFLITVYAPGADLMDDRAFCALIEHELYHCGQQHDGYGEPMFNRQTGEPIFAVKGHDVEEFTGIVKRYGVTSPELRTMIDAAKDRPLLADFSIATACGVCQAKAA